MPCKLGRYQENTKTPIVDEKTSKIYFFSLYCQNILRKKNILRVISRKCYNIGPYIMEQKIVVNVLSTVLVSFCVY